MAYQLSWLLENRILLIRYQGTLTLKDLETYLPEAARMRDQANAFLGANGPLVHTITDASQMEKNAISLPEALQATRLTVNNQQRVGWSVYISAGVIDRFFSTAGHQLAGVRYRAVDSIDEAVAFLKSVDDTLSDFVLPPAE
ncbi:MAG TPA: hypothetical protein PLQ56_00415 [Aggregatilineales bacterium]|nr:hypothetical protein [Aggregatilineales bacterium]